MAICATRVMLTCAVIGQASGTAAGLCAALDVDPRALHRDHLFTLQQQLLKDGAHIVELPNRDPRDLARRAAASASSAATDARGRPTPAADAIDGSARAARGRASVWRPDPEAPGPHWIELGWAAPQTFNCVHVSFLTEHHRAARFEIQTPHGDGWTAAAQVQDNRHRRRVVGFEPVTASRLRICFPDPADASRLALAELRVYLEEERALRIAERARRTRELPEPDPGFRFAHLVSAPRPAPDGVRAETLPGVVLDDCQASEIVGQWIHSGHTRPYIGAGYLHDGDADKGAKSVAFTPRIPRRGRYEIRLGYSPGPNRAARVPVTVRAGPETRTVEIDQRKPAPVAPVFVSIGTFDLDPARRLEVSVENRGTTGYVTVDAVQLVTAQGQQ